MKPSIFIFALAVSVVEAGLQWEAKEQTLAVHPAQVEAEAVFRFSNSGKKPVMLSDVKVNCGCLAPQLTKRSWTPGESGELTIKFDLRNRTGKQRKAVTVKTSDGVVMQLHIVCDIPKSYVVNPPILRFARGGTVAQKTIHLVNAGPLPVKLVSLSSSYQGLPAELKTIREGFEYDVVVTRENAKVSARSVVRIKTEPPPGLTESKTLRLYIHAQ
jgi:hypothetical protein